MKVIHELNDLQRSHYVKLVDPHNLYAIFTDILAKMCYNIHKM